MKSPNKVILVQFKKNKDSITGILLKETDNWLLLKLIAIDYQIDGYVLINCKNIMAILSTEKEEFKKNVLISSRKWINKQNKFKSLDLINFDNVFDFFIHRKNVVQIEDSSNDMAYIGQINAIDESFVSIRQMSPKAIWLDDKKIAKSKIWCLFFENDYINSLTSFNKSLIGE